MKVDDLEKRSWYEASLIKANWNVKDLKRQIETLLYERSGSIKKKLSISETKVRMPVFRDPYVLEFTGLPEKAEWSENDLETALLNKLQDFLLELGVGFCFEARQKRISIDGEHDRIDLVFYHRLLKCHVLVDLKVRAFKHQDAGQMNFYLNYYKNEVMEKGDNPPIGLLLCTGKNKVKVEYSTAGMDSKLFVSKYQVALPRKEELESLLIEDKKRLEESRKK